MAETRRSFVQDKSVDSCTLQTVGLLWLATSPLHVYDPRPALSTFFFLTFSSKMKHSYSQERVIHTTLSPRHIVAAILMKATLEAYTPVDEATE